jgi:type II secretory pathway pseudopilin PulG
MRPRPHSRDGFTLAEILLAFSILLLGAVGVFALFGRGLVAHRRAVNNVNAANLAASVFEDIASNYDVYYRDRNGDGTPDIFADADNDGTPDCFNAAPGERLRWPIPQRSGYTYTIRYTRSLDARADRTLFVSVRVSWNVQGRDLAEEFSRVVFIKDLRDIDASK